MSADLGLSDRVYGLGVGMFYVTYVLFEIPGAIIVALIRSDEKYELNNIPHWVTTT
jgi:hypothetical protein